MASFKIRLFILTLLCGVYMCDNFTDYMEKKLPRIVITILIRNKAHVLPYFLTSLYRLAYPKDRLTICVYTCDKFDDYEEKKLPRIVLFIWVGKNTHILPFLMTSLYGLDYPKDRLTIRIHSDYNSDISTNIIHDFTRYYASKYHGFYFVENDVLPRYHNDENYIINWTQERYKHVIQLRENAIQYAKKLWADYVFMLDADVMLTDPNALKNLMKLNQPIVAPMLNTDGMYSNFWHGMTQDYTYKRTELYSAIYKREPNSVGCHVVPMVHTAVLIDLQYNISDVLTYDPEKVKDYDGPDDDTVVFAVNAAKNGIPLKVCNDMFYGYVTIPVQENSTLEKEDNRLLNVKLHALAKGMVLPLDGRLAKFVKYPEKSKLGMSKIFMINLPRQSERRHLMFQSFKELGMDVELFEGVDGKSLTPEDLAKLDIRLMPSYRDPLSGRKMKTGEIGCFLSHYYLWKKVLENQYKMVMILEDDVHFLPFFKQKLHRVLEEAKEHDYDLLYLGRKILSLDGEIRVSKHLMAPVYTYWTLGYILTYRGAAKLIEVNPLRNMVPVDEFLPIMFDAHPNTSLKEMFPRRSVKALSAHPLILEPTHYTGMKGYISDTEDTVEVGKEEWRKWEL